MNRARNARSKRAFAPRRLRWWQLRLSDYGLFLLPVIIQRALLLPLWILAAVAVDDGMEISRALDATYLGWHAPSTLAQIIGLTWVLLGVAILTAVRERPYHWIKATLVFAVLAGLAVVLTVHALTLYEPYLNAG